MKTTILICHNDMDGAAAALVAEKFLLNEEKYVITYFSEAYEVYAKIQEAVNTVSDIEEFILIDCSISEEQFKTVRKDYKLICIDHHISSQYIKNIPGCVWDDSKCGALLAYKHYSKLNSDVYEGTNYLDLCILVNDRDLFINKIPVSGILSNFYQAVGTNAWYGIIKSQEAFEITNAMILISDAFDEKKEKQCQLLVDNAVITEINGTKVALLGDTKMVSDTSKIILDGDESISVVIGFNFITGSTSARSRRGTDCALTFMKSMGVEAKGHPSACGAGKWSQTLVDIYLQGKK